MQIPTRFSTKTQPVYDTHYTLHPTHYTLHTTYYTLHPTHYTLHTTRYTLHTIHYTLHTIHPVSPSLPTLHVVVLESPHRYTLIHPTSLHTLTHPSSLHTLTHPTSLHTLIHPTSTVVGDDVVQYVPGPQHGTGTVRVSLKSARMESSTQ